MLSCNFSFMLFPYCTVSSQWSYFWSPAIFRRGSVGLNTPIWDQSAFVEGSLLNAGAFNNVSSGYCYGSEAYYRLFEEKIPKCSCDNIRWTSKTNENSPATTKSRSVGKCFRFCSLACFLVPFLVVSQNYSSILRSRVIKKLCGHAPNVVMIKISCEFR